MPIATSLLDYFTKYEKPPHGAQAKRRAHPPFPHRLNEVTALGMALAGLIAADLADQG